MRTKIFNSILFDPQSDLHLKPVEILIEGDIIAEIAKSVDKSADQTIDAKGAYVSAGWIDIHVHCYYDPNNLGLHADTVGCKTGVVCVCDAGSAGHTNLDDFYQSVKDQKTIVKSFINIASTGLAYKAELRDPANVDVAKTIEKIREYPNFIVGIKVRASASVMGEDTDTPFIKAREAAKATNKPIMVHYGNKPPLMEDVLQYLHRGDILTHCFHGKPNGVLNEDDKIKELVWTKRKEGLLFDVGHGNESFSYEKGKKAHDCGFDADMISTDAHRQSFPVPVSSLANVLSKMLEIGYSLEEVIACVTSRPAQYLDMRDEFGHVSKGGKAHLTFFKVDPTPVTVVDSSRKEILLNRQILTQGCMISGEYLEVE